MRFQSAHSNASYVVRRDMGEPTPGLPPPPRGLKAKFLGEDRLFDSERAQRELGWTDEERLLVERHLLTHRDFGRRRSRAQGGLYLAPGQDVPPEHADLGVEAGIAHEAAAQVRLAEAGFRCAFVWTTSEGIKQCPDEVAQGSQFCEGHTEQLEAVSTEVSAAL